MVADRPLGNVLSGRKKKDNIKFILAFKVNVLKTQKEYSRVFNLEGL